MSRPPIASMIPEGQIGKASIQHFRIGEKRDFFAMREGIPPGQYCRLSINGKLYMSDTPFEWNTNWRIRHEATGRVLIAGLGIGLVLGEVLANPKVSSVTVIEKHQDVINLVAPHWHHDKLVIICADIMEWQPPKDEKWDTIYFDIWPDVCTDNLAQITTLHRRFAKRLNRDNPKAWMDSWQRDELLYRRRRERAEDARWGRW